MAWNDPSKIDYGQLGSGDSKSFKHDYVSPNLDQVTNMLHQPLINQTSDHFNNYGLNLAQQQPQNNVDLQNTVPTTSVSYPNNHIYHQPQQQQQPSPLQVNQAYPNFNQFQNHNYQQQPTAPSNVPISTVPFSNNHPYYHEQLPSQPSSRIYNQHQGNDQEQQQALSTPSQLCYLTSEQEHQQPPPHQDTVQPIHNIGHSIHADQNIHSGQSRYNAATVDACSSIVQSLCRHICGDSEFCRRAIESLVKKMKEKRDELDSLITAVTTGGAVPTACVTIQRTLDGRLQVAGKKGFPHVIYAKIWRWPDLTRNELKPIRTCQYGFNMYADLICVNPYHYDRVVATPGSLAYDDSSIYDCELSPVMSNVIADYDSPPVLVEQQNQQPIQSQDRLNQPSRITQNDQLQMHMDHTSVKRESTASASNSGQQYLPKQLHNHTTTSTNVAGNLQQTTGASRYLSHIPPPEFWCTISYFELDQQVGESFRAQWQRSSVTIDGYTDPSATDRFCLGYVNNDHRSSDVQKARLHIGPGIKLGHDGGNVFLTNLSNQPVFLNSPYLDFINNELIGNAVVKIRPKDHLEVFNLRRIHEMLIERAETARQAAAAQAAAVSGKTQIDLPGNLANSDQLEAAAAIGVDDLRRYCVFSISFVKGWGPDYQKRTTIKQCPCWVEINIHRAMQLLDDLLRHRL